MSSEYRNNHYVPIWYQRRFLPSGQRDKELFYLNLNPATVRDSQGIIHTKNAVRRLGFRHCFVERDLYTIRFGSEESTRIEQLFFGEIDAKGRAAVDYFTNFEHPSANGENFQNLMMYMSTQKLRTPKGLGWLASRVHTSSPDETLRLMLELRQLHCAMWTECIWLIADASLSDTKFIISDHPVTVYNRRCGPRSMWCRDNNDPDIWFHGTHTIFPLSLDKILILTNLSWVRNPYQAETAIRPNPSPWRTAFFNFMNIQTLRYLNEPEVQQINFIIKSRALRYIAAAREQWLYPDKHMSKSQWHLFGDGYLLMPDPRAVDFGGEVIIGYRDGRSAALDPYGRRPGQPDYGLEGKSMDEFDTLHRFKGEFARLYGPYRRGRSFAHGMFDRERDDDEYHQYHLGLEKKHKRGAKK